MRHFGFDRSWGTSLSALSLGLALVTAQGAGAQSVPPTSVPVVLEQSPVQPRVTPEFVEAVRQALVQNPEIFLEVISVLEADQAAEEAGKNQALIEDNAEILFAGLDPTKPILLEFQDYNCGYCRRVHPDVAALSKDNPDLQLVVMEFPILGEDSVYTAEIGLAVKALYGQDTYRRFSDSILLADSAANPATVLRILNLLGLDAQEVTKASKAPSIAEELQRVAYVARTMGVRGTPAFVGPSGISRGAINRAQMAALAAPAQPSSKGE